MGILFPSERMNGWNPQVWENFTANNNVSDFRQLSQYSVSLSHSPLLSNGSDWLASSSSQVLCLWIQPLLSRLFLLLSSNTSSFSCPQRHAPRVSWPDVHVGKTLVCPHTIYYHPTWNPGNGEGSSMYTKRRVGKKKRILSIVPMSQSREPEGEEWRGTNNDSNGEGKKTRSKWIK